MFTSSGGVIAEATVTRVAPMSPVVPCAEVQGPPTPPLDQGLHSHSIRVTRFSKFNYTIHTHTHTHSAAVIQHLLALSLLIINNYLPDKNVQHFNIKLL